MESSVENLGKLKRKIKITVPNENIKITYQKCYEALKRKVKIPGFRPGKFPKDLMEKRFKEHMKQEALETIVPNFYNKALKENNLNPATKPKFHELVINKDEPFIFDVTFEVIPDFEIPDFTKISINKRNTIVTDEEKELKKKEYIDRFSNYELKDAGAEESDQVVIDYVGSVDGVEFDGGKAVDQIYIVGSKKFLPEFEEALLGIKADSEKKIIVNFPEDYHSENLKGKLAEFDLKVKKVKKQVKPELNESFFNKVSAELKNQSDFEKFIKKELENTKEYQNQIEYRKELTTFIDGKISFHVPEEILEQELQIRLHHSSNDISEEDKKKKYTEEITKQLRMNYLVEKAKEQDNIEIKEDLVREKYIFHAYMMGKNPREFIQTNQGQEILHQVKTMLLEEEVLNQILKKVVS